MSPVMGGSIEWKWRGSGERDVDVCLHASIFCHRYTGIADGHSNCSADATPTPDPVAILRVAEHAAFNGDDSSAISLYREALGRMPDVTGEVALRARFDMARSQLGAGDAGGRSTR